jgi:DNA-binding beta-propeller fold protein YncE
MKYAQNVRVDPQDNVWAVDAGTNTVTKYDSNGNFVLVLGRAPEAVPVRQGQGVKARLIDPDPAPPAPGAGGGGGGGAAMAGRPPGSGPEANSFNRPTDIAFDKAGNAYVADGMGNNNRIAKFNSDGNFVKTWGQTGSGQGQFNKVMGIASDSAGNLYVADAGNNRIQVFDGEGNFKSQITGIGTPLAICVSGGPTQFIYSSNSNDPESMEKGEIYKISLSGQVVGRFGKAGRIPGEFGMVNSLDCRTETSVLVGEVWNWRVTKVTLK